MQTKGMQTKAQRIFRTSIFLLSSLLPMVVLGRLGVARVKAEQSDDKVQLPEGQGKEIVAQKCVTCHTLEKVTKEKHTQAEWKDLLEIMVSQGLELTPEEYETVLQYLTTNFGKPDSVPPPRTQSPTGGSKKEVTYSKDVAPILYQHCVGC